MADQCGLCSGTMSTNPHPEAGNPSKLLEVGATLECIPCLTSARHGWASQLQQAQGEIERLKDACRKALDGFHFTREYVGEQMLPASEGWSWYDATVALQAALAEEGDTDAKPA